METDLSKGKTKTLEAEGVSVSPVFGRPSITGGGDIIGRDIITIIDNVAKASPNDVQAIAANQIGLLLTYHEIVLAQSRRSFAWALIGAGMGLAFFMAAAGYIIWTGRAVEAIIPAASGAVVEVVAGIVFYLYGKTTSQMGDFYSRLERLQRYLLANSICESLQGEQRDKTRSDLIREIAEVTSRTSKGQVEAKSA